MIAIERAKKYGLALLEYNCMDLLYGPISRSTNNVLGRLEDRAVLHKVTDGNLHYDAVSDAIKNLLKLGIAHHTHSCVWDDYWWLTNYGEQLLKAFHTDGG